MSIESKLSELTAAVTALTQALMAARSVNPMVDAAAAPVVVTQAPVPAPAPAPVAPPVAPVAASAMPTPPFAPPAAPAPAPAVPAAAPAAVPFSDGASLVNYVMSTYQQLGPEKGAQIQGVLVQLGYQNINDVRPEHYAPLYAGIEALKA